MYQYVLKKKNTSNVDRELDRISRSRRQDAYSTPLINNKYTVVQRTSGLKKIKSQRSLFVVWVACLKPNKTKQKSILNVYSLYFKQHSQQQYISLSSPHVPTFEFDLIMHRRV